MRRGDRAMKEFVTERLRLRGWRRDDAPALAAMNADPEVMRYIGSGAIPYAQALERAERLVRERPFLWSEMNLSESRLSRLGISKTPAIRLVRHLRGLVLGGWRSFERRRARTRRHLRQCSIESEGPNKEYRVCTLYR